jgi:hypothetical protein
VKSTDRFISEHPIQKILKRPTYYTSFTETLKGFLPVQYKKDRRINSLKYDNVRGKISLG